MGNIGQHIAYEAVIVPLTKPPQLQVETLHPALVGWVLTLPSITLLLGHCILGQDPDNEVGVQYKLTERVPEVNPAVKPRTGMNEMLLV